MGVGIGEAVLAPCALSMISDMFPRDRLAKPIGVYTMGISMGSGLAFALGGAAISWIEHARGSYAALAHLDPWRGAFFLVGLPGLLLVPLFLTLREPERRERVGGAGSAPSLGDTVRFIASRWRSYVPLFAGKAVVNTLGYAHFWIPAMFQRTWGWSAGRIGPAYGAIVLVAGLVGVNLGGWLADRWYQRGQRDASLRAMLLALGLIIVFHTLAPLMPNGTLALALLFPALIGGAIGSATGSSAAMLVTPNEYRGQVAALSLLIAGGTGLFLGPTSVAFLTQFVLGGEQQLRYGLALAVLGFALVGLVLLLWGRRAYREELERLEARITPG
jgi:MFS family permease